MDDIYKNNEMTAEEKIVAVNNLKKNLEDNFVSLGQLLSEIKRTKLYKFKGYKNFQEFVEKEFNLSNTFANRLIGTYELFIEELDVDETSVKNIGLDKLNMIKPLVKDTDYRETEDWIKKAEELPTSELREEIKEIRDLKKKQDVSLKDVFIDQFMEKMVTFFNCSKKELNFKLALYFQDADLDAVRDEIRIRQRKFDESGEV
ncbi:MAG TPA: hypothetical protein PLD62_11215 [Candidatus Cloacimonadota bacterium]|nr:hypothetical protein [Candidatus Cloacimonadota bacterium]